MHYGVKRRSGRYPYGSGEEPYQHGMDFLGRYEQLKSRGMSDRDIAKELNYSIIDLDKISKSTKTTKKQTPKKDIF